MYTLIYLYIYGSSITLNFLKMSFSFKIKTISKSIKYIIKDTTCIRKDHYYLGAHIFVIVFSQPNYDLNTGEYVLK